MVLGDNKPLPPNNPTYAVVSLLPKVIWKYSAFQVAAFQRLLELAADHDFIATMMGTDRSTMSLAAVLKKREL